MRIHSLFPSIVSLLAVTSTSSAQATLAAPAAPVAPDTAALPFRAGQWGAHILIGSGFDGAGVVRFTSPTRAWILDAAMGGTLGRTVDDSVRSKNQVINLNAQFGRRRFVPLAPRATGFLTYGLRGSFFSSHGETLRQRGAGGGLFADVGGQYLVTSHFGIGMSAAATLTYSWTRQEADPPVFSPRTRTTRSYSLTAGLLQVVAGIYF